MAMEYCFQLHRISPLFLLSEEKGRDPGSKPLENFCAMHFLSKKKCLFAIERALQEHFCSFAEEDRDLYLPGMA